MTKSRLRYQSAPERRTRIIARLREVGILALADLARELGVSPMTVRRDLEQLEAAGHVRTVHGGVSLAPAPRVPVIRADGDEDTRRQIAESTVKMIGDDDAIAVDAGATAYELVQALPPSFRGSVITHSMPVMQLVTERPAPPRLVALGGELLSTRLAFVGSVALTAIRQMRVRTFFLSAAAADMRGLYAQSGSEAGVERLLMDVADQVVLLAPHEVFTGSAPALVGPLSRLTAVVSDRPPPNLMTTAFRQAGIAIHLAGGTGHTSTPRGPGMKADDENSGGSGTE